MLKVLQELDSVTLNFNEGSSLYLNITIAIIMFGVALELKVSDFKTLFTNPKPIVVGLFSQFFIMPALTFILAIIFSSYITPTVALGMILVASCPGGNISNFISSLSLGNIALSVSLTAFSSLGGLILTPFNFTLWGSMYLSYLSTSAGGEMLPQLVVDPISIFTTILFILGIPLLLGVLFTTWKPELSKRIQKGFKVFSITAFGAIIVIIFSSNFDLFIKYISYIFLIVLIHNALALLSGYYSSRLLKLSKRDRRTISIETGIQNSGLALALLFNPAIFPPDVAIGGMAFIAAWWGVWHIIAGLSIATYWRTHKIKVEASPISAE